MSKSESKCWRFDTEIINRASLRRAHNSHNSNTIFIMGLKVKAVERNISFEKNVEKWAYVLKPELYNKLSAAKVISEASLRSGISKGSMTAAWDAIGEVIKAWATEGHSVAIPGLGTTRFGLRSTSVDDVNKVSSDLITSRKIIFTPSVDIKSELKSTSISITCYDRNGKVVKQVLSSDDGNIDEDENNNQSDDNGGTNNGNGGGSNEGGF